MANSRLRGTNNNLSCSVVGKPWQATSRSSFSPGWPRHHFFLLFHFSYFTSCKPESQLQLQQGARSIFVPSEFASQLFPAVHMNVPHEEGLEA